MNEWATIISSVGFPIAMCCGMAYFIYTMQMKVQESIVKLNEVVSRLETSYTDNTKVIQLLIDKLEKED